MLVCEGWMNDDQKRVAMRVSMVVLVCSVERYLRECLDSLKIQTLVDMKFVCVDGSTDSPLSILRKYANADDRIRLIFKPNVGCKHTLNHGIRAARGEYTELLFVLVVTG